METLTCRLLPDRSAEGAWNMAADEVMLDAALAGQASFRLYEWSPATLSLGYFQHAHDRHSDPLLASLPLVRRPSGGSALVHDRELTYALALPAGSPWQAPGQRRSSWLAKMHTVIQRALEHLDIQVAAAPSANCSGSFLCFQCIAVGDLLIGPDKVVGSAQRHHRGALLQHGAILLKRSRFTPQLPGIAELAGRDVHAGRLREAVQDELSRTLGWKLVSAPWTAQERERVEKLARMKYGSPEWNEKR